MYYVAYSFVKDCFLAEEIMHDAFIKAYKKIDTFCGDVSFGAWLKRIVINTSLDRLKARKLETVALNEHIITTQEDYDFWEVENQSVTVDQVKQAIDELPDKYRYPIHLFLVEGYDHNEISEILGITSVASRTLVYRAKKKLQNQFNVSKDGTEY